MEVGHTKTFDQFCRQYEKSFDGHVDSPDGNLPRSCYGRGTTLTPQTRSATFPLLRPSRPGEVAQPTELLGRHVQQWFRQLRRLQSLLHGLRAAKDTADAVAYRLELWSAIKRAKGFQDGFDGWWSQRPVQLQGTPTLLPVGVPSVEVAEILFQDFQVNYRRFESWHVGQRKALLQVTFQSQESKIFGMITPTGKAPLTQLEETHSVHVLAQSDDGKQIQVSEPLDLHLPFTIKHDDFALGVEEVQQDILHTDGDTLVQPGTQLDATQRYVTPPEIHYALGKYWSARWWKDPPPPEAWDRIFAFAKAYLPRHHLDVEPINVESWSLINKRYTQRAARGPDGACFFSFMGFRLVTSARCGGGFFAGFASGFRWCLAVLSRSPGGCCFGRVWARLRCVLCPRAGACFFSFMGFRLVTSARCGGGFFAGFASGFRWCLAVLSRSPGGCCFGRVWARLRCVLCPRAGACFFSFMGFRLGTLRGKVFCWVCVRI